jgi:uncharacterized damage-inducible protein DinB
MLKTTLVLLVAAQTLSAQSSASPSASPVGDVRMLWMQTRDYLAKSAAAMPESDYSYKPVASVRTFGQLIGHVAGSQNMFCAIALGEKPPTEDAVEKSTTSKSGLMAALKQSNDYCDRAYAQSDAAVSGTVDLFGSARSRLFTLAMNAMHDGEHYGNIVTYMRMRGMVPPSSQPSP